MHMHPRKARSARHISWLRKTRRFCACAILPVVTMACQPGTEGHLEPARGEQRGPEGPDQTGTVAKSDGLVDAHISGHWRSRLDVNRIDVQVRYTNRGRDEVVLDPRTFAAVRERDGATVFEVIDMTGIDHNDARTDNDQPVTIMGSEETGRTDAVIRLAPAQTRRIEARLILPEGVADIDTGQEITVAVPAGAGITQARFEADTRWF
mgnify:CR=1 FL=1